MNSTTIPQKKAILTTTLNEPYLPSLLTFNDAPESEELTLSEKACFERAEERHLAYSNIDLHY
jgi:hypothetical protein